MKTEDPEALFMRKEFFKHLLASLRRLPEEMRTAVVLREFSGMNYEEISEVMEIPLGTVRSKIFRARARLREMLEPYVYES
jgi:RNA polymerase sigma-70 factor (ECF subfamily)